MNRVMPHQQGWELPTDDLYLTVLYKGPERYVFFWDKANRAELLRTFGRWATNPELSFTWEDCVALAAKIRYQIGGAGE